ncbi:histidine phosphatase family protein [Sediminispirochaeta bajacaliforniensis]|uniref:histidine phosphatase family protein n=1 Tax=Sediminispirochaeta bajacaliforniensis TaxID=148 RepID=UPI00035C1F88|nr:histidine phosphatase family protein [Sediminispirochaeta bajacaliforniensis]
MILYFIRHAESVANKKRILASRLPYHLTAEGKHDADLIASELKRETSLDRIISSPLVRAVETAESFGKAFSLPIETDDRLSEYDLGIFSGKGYDEVKTIESYESDPLNRWDWCPEGGESYAMIAARVKDFLHSVEELPANQKVLIVTHAVALRLIHAVLKHTLPHYPATFPNNGEIWKVDFTKTGKVHEIESLLLGNSRDFVHQP